MQFGETFNLSEKYPFQIIIPGSSDIEKVHK